MKSELRKPNTKLVTDYSCSLEHIVWNVMNVSADTAKTVLTQQLQNLPEQADLLNM